MAKVIVLFEGYSLTLEDRMEANCTCTLIKAEKNIIVDTMTPWDGPKIIEALNENGLKPEDIDYVVCTHNHADHVGNNHLFLNAIHIVGSCIHKGPKFFGNDIKSKEPYSICEGVNVLRTPGHTTDDVSVLVSANLDGNKVLIAIAGDLFEKEEDIVDPSIWQELGTTKLRSTQSQMRKKIITKANYIIPGHGPMFKVTDQMISLCNF